jgi:Zn-dependent peptidase ImmA (M78 family)
MEMRIGLYTWTIKLVDRKSIDGMDGRCLPNDFEILIADDLNGQARLLSFIHELVHAIMDTQGRCYTKKLGIEEMCEFIAWKYPEIEECVNDFCDKIGG